MRKFLDRYRNRLMMSAAGADPLAGGGGAASNDNFLQSLPETLRGNEAFKDVKDVGDLATRYADTRKPFAEMLPEDIRGEAYFKDIKDLGGLAKTAFNQAKMIGADKATIVALPKGPDDKDGTKAIFARLGTPESADKYVLPKPEGGKDYSPEEATFHKAILPVLHEANLTQAQLNAVVPAWNKMMAANAKSTADAQAAGMKTASDALRSEWGAAYDQNVALAGQALAQLGSPELAKELEAAGADGKGVPLGNNPALMKLFAKLGGQLKEDGLLGKGEGTGGGDLSPAEAQQQINALRGDDKFKEAWLKKDHPGHADAVAQLERLYKFANPA